MGGIQTMADWKGHATHLVLKDKMELLELAQGDGVDSLACYVQDFNWMLIIVPFKMNSPRSWSFYMN
jgi:hypothetical protein